MNIVLLCSKHNILGNKLVIYTTLYCNSNVTWIICLTEDIGEQEERNLQNLVAYLDPLSSVVFEKINEQQSLEQQFHYLTEFLYISADCLVAQSLNVIYEYLCDNKYRFCASNTQPRYCAFFVGLEENKIYNKETYIKFNKNEILEVISQEESIEFFGSRIGGQKDFSFYINLPIIFWFDNENLKIYDTDLNIWFEKYPSFKPYIEQIKLAETIYF